MHKNVVEHKLYVIVHNNVVQNPEQQSRKKHSREKSSLPDDSKMLARAAEVLRQVEGTGLEKWLVWWKFLVRNCLVLHRITETRRYE